MVFGIVFLVIGLLGFISAVSPDGLLLGVFEVDPIHNVIHVLTGILALVFMKTQAKMFFKVFGIVYLLVTLVGFFQGTTVLGLFGVNMADNVLHLVVAAIALWLGFRKEGTMAMPM